MDDYGDIYERGLYRYMCGRPYQEYVDSAVEIILSKAGGAKNALSVGCGNGDIEAAIGDRLNLTLHDLHGAARKAHPDLFWLPHMPNGQYDFVYAFGSVFACVPPNEKQKFIDDMAARVSDGGTMYVCPGNSKKACRCRAKVYSENGETVTEAVLERGPDWHVTTHHVWGIAKLNVMYFEDDLEKYVAPHRGRINIITRP